MATHRFSEIREASVANARTLPIALDTGLTAESIVVRRPHYRLDGYKAYFLISNRPAALFTGEELLVWQAIDGVRSVRELREMFTERVDEVLKKFIRSRLCEQLQARFPGGRRRVLVIEPHMDDAALSVGGTMWQLRNECEFNLVTGAGVSNFTTYYFMDREYFDPQVVSAVRRAESSLFMKHLGGRHLGLDMLEAPLRYQGGQWTLEWFRQNRFFVDAFIWHSARPAENESWAGEIWEVIARIAPQEIWMPLGVGTHTDHELTRNACLRILREHPMLLHTATVKFFQDVPYAARFPNHTGDLLRVLKEAGAELKEERADVSDVMSAKLHLASIYGCQLKIDVFRSSIEDCGARAGAGRCRYAELFYRVAVAPKRQVNYVSVYAQRKAVEEVGAQLEQWLPRARRARVIKFLSLMPSGRWADDMQVLLRVFPDVHFEMHLAASNVPETRSFDSPRVTIRAVRPGKIWWGADFLRATVAGGRCPFVIVAGPYFEKAGLARRVLGERVVVTQSLNHLILALDSHQGRNGD